MNLHIYLKIILKSKENKMIRPKLHKIYGDYLFEKKRFMKAAEEYANSDENFEHVCIKFLSTNNNLALLKYLSLVYYLRMKKHIGDNKDNDDSYFIEKYLINTFIFELLIGINENKNNRDVISAIRCKRKDKIYFDTYYTFMEKTKNF